MVPLHIVIAPTTYPLLPITFQRNLQTPNEIITFGISWQYSCVCNGCLNVSNCIPKTLPIYLFPRHITATWKIAIFKNGKSSQIIELNGPRLPVRKLLYRLPEGIFYIHDVPILIGISMK